MKKVSDCSLTFSVQGENLIKYTEMRKKQSRNLLGRVTKLDNMIFVIQ